MKRILFLLAIIIAGCASPPAGAPASTPAQTALNTTTASCKSIDSAILAADQAVLSGVLKGQDKANAVKGLTTAQAGCVAALAALQSATAASGAAK